MNVDNKIRITFPSYSKNESLARSVVSCFSLTLNPSVAEINDIKTAVSEAVTNAIVHGYPDAVGDITIEAQLIDREIHINVIDNGVGIGNLKEALEPFYTTKPEDERSGMGFTIMQSFMDKVVVESKEGSGTSVYMVKNLKTDA